MKSIVAAAILAASVQSYECNFAHILGATWGPADVTAQVSHSYNLGHKDFDATSERFFDSWKDNKKTLTIVYDICGNVATAVAVEGDSINLP